MNQQTTGPTITFGAAAYQVSEGVGQVSLTVTRTGGTGGAVSVNYATSDGSALAGADYTAASGTLTFAAGETQKSISVPVTDDAAVEGSETFTVTLSNAAGGAALGTPSAATVTITDNDTCTYSLSTTSHTSPAAGGSVDVTVTAPAGCQWTASSNSGFITVTSGASGSGNGTVTLAVAANGTGVSRTGTITVAGLTFTVTQAASGPAAPSVQFSQAGYQATEAATSVTLAVTRTGDTSAAAAVDYRTVDADTFTVGCADAAGAGGAAYGRCDFATTVGTLQFNPGETTKTINVPLVDDAHAEGPETFQLQLSNASGAAIGAAGAATVTIEASDPAGGANPVTGPPFSFFVRQQYLDFLSREPDQAGFNAWLGVLNGCPNPFAGPEVQSGCDRIHVSGEGFFRSVEFQSKGASVFRFYKVAFNRLPEYTEIVSDMSFVAGQTEQEVFARRAELAVRFTQRQEFQALYAGLSNEQYVAVLLGRYNLQQVTARDPLLPDTGPKVVLTRAELIGRLDSQTLSRAQVLRAVADSDEVGAAEFNNAFVAVQYYGYLRRKPEPTGYEAWLRVLRSGDTRTMVDGFLNSPEYKLRFGQP